MQPKLPGAGVVAFTIFCSPRRLARFWRSMSLRRATYRPAMGRFEPRRHAVCFARHGPAAKKPSAESASDNMRLFVARMISSRFSPGHECPSGRPRLRSTRDSTVPPARNSLISRYAVARLRPSSAASSANISGRRTLRITLQESRESHQLVCTLRPKSPRLSRRGRGQSWQAHGEKHPRASISHKVTKSKSD